MTKTFLALGSNIEPRQQFLTSAIRKLRETGVIQKIAPLYETAPYGNVDQPDFLNTAVILLTPLEPQQLLEKLKHIEADIGRRKREKWGPREIDIDIIFFGELIFNSPDLIIPHPDYRNRIFVLKPLVDLEQEFRAPDTGMTLQEMLRKCSDGTKIKFIQKNWVPDGIVF